MRSGVGTVRTYCPPIVGHRRYSSTCQHSSRPSRKFTMPEKIEEQSSPETKNVVDLGIGIKLHPPLSQKGHGPPLIIVVPEAPAGVRGQAPAQTQSALSSLQKWAEEGFAVVEIQPSSFEAPGGVDAVLLKAFEGLDECTSCDGGNAGLIGSLNHPYSLEAASVLID